jgi:hypothetical protein
VIRDYGQRGREMVKKRILARLDGVAEDELPAFPSDRKALSGELLLLRNKLQAARTRSQAVEIFEKLSVYELEYLGEILKSDAELNRRLTSFANAVISVKVTGNDVLQKRIEKWQGSELSAAIIDELRACCLEGVTKSKAYECRVDRAKGFGGCNLTIRTISSDEMTAGMRKAKESDRGISGISGLVAAEGLYGSARWRTAPKPKKLYWGMLRTSSPDQMYDFEVAVQGICDGSVPASSEGIVRFIAKGYTNED